MLALVQIIQGLEADIIGARDEYKLNIEAEQQRAAAGPVATYDMPVDANGDEAVDEDAGKFITCRGKGPGVPKYLRTNGKVKNRNLSEAKVSLMLANFWKWKQKSAGSEALGAFDALPLTPYP